VALARAHAHNPEVLLLAEPVGALDAKIREELRRTIRQVQRELGITTVLVTHDQEEAFALADRIGVMNLGRLLEMGPPGELYTRPATRFVATFLGAANLLLGHQTRNGIHFGNAGFDGTRSHEVVAVLRPEEVELAPVRAKLDARYLAAGTVEEIIFTGALERMRVRLTKGSDEVQLARANNGDDAFLEVTRTQPEQRAFGVKIGQDVAVGFRRVHVLPTPLSSFTACAANESEVESLSRHPLLVELATRMSTRVSSRVEPALASSSVDCAAMDRHFSGAAVIASRPDALKNIECLLTRGAEEVLVLPANAPSPQRVLIHWADEAARAATLAVSASMLRHVSAEAVYLDVKPEHTAATDRPQGMRGLLDARSEAQAVHGLEMRTELHFGDATSELVRRLGESSDQLLILGVSQIAGLAQRFAELLAAIPRSPLLIVYREPESVSEPQTAVGMA
jgi:hypothetical protein